MALVRAIEAHASQLGRPAMYLAYFGYPQAHEHDAERAVHTGLALVEAVPKLKIAISSPLQVRIGIAAGLVVVGDLIGKGAAQEQAVVGDPAAVGAPGA